MTLTVALPAADRRVSYDFYRALGYDTPGEPAGDGVPEPLRVVVNDGVQLMLIPPGGFGWTIAGRPVAGRDDPTECQLVAVEPDRDGVRAHLERARAAGAEMVAEPEDRGWAFAANFADPDGHLWMVMTGPG